MTFAHPSTAADAAVQADHDHPLASACPSTVDERICHYVSAYLRDPADDPSGLLRGWPTLTFQVAVSVDAELVNHYGSQLGAKVNETVAHVERTYEEAFGITIEIVDLHRHDESTYDGSAANLLDEVASHYEAEHGALSRELVHHFTGKDTVVSGVANTASANTSGAYSWSVLAHDDRQTIVGPFGTGAHGYTEVAAHEIGHTLGGEHRYANCAESLPAHEPPNPVDACTTMFPVGTVTTTTFSSANRLFIRGYAEDHI